MPFLRMHLALTLLLFSSTVLAQTVELTSADRLAQLYSSQLIFEAGAEPSARIGIAEGLSAVDFAPSAPFRVLPTGPEGPELLLPADQTYRIELSEGKAGTYRYYVVLERVDGSQLDAINAAKTKWKAHHPQTLEVGSLFAISGKVFDTRQSLIVTAEMTQEQATTLKARLEAEHGSEFAIHSDLVNYPSATLTLRAEKMTMVLRHRDILWVELDGAPITLKQLPDEQGKPVSRRYQGALVFAPDRQGKLVIINVAPIEEVLRGVVPAELYPSAPLESLKVQSIAARNILLAQIGTRHLADPYHLCAQQHCQAYHGLDAATLATDKAISATRGLVLFDQKRLAETFYSSNCGGTAERPEAVWGTASRSYLEAHHDDAASQTLSSSPTDATVAQWLSQSPTAWCNLTTFSSGKHFRWKKSLEAKELDALVAKQYDVGSVQDLRIQQRGFGGRIITLDIVGSRKTVSIERELNIRRLFGGLRSGLFVIDIERDNANRPRLFHFNGGGFGHGVGMCQTGAMGMASAGHDFAAILQHYYRGTRLEKLW